MDVICQALGGHPPPKITWWLGSKQLAPYDEVCVNIKYEKITINTVWDTENCLHCVITQCTITNIENAAKKAWALEQSAFQGCFALGRKVLENSVLALENFIRNYWPIRESLALIVLNPGPRGITTHKSENPPFRTARGNSEAATF